MKALTIHQPWASLIADGDKTIETRVWTTKYRGPLAIHASRQRYEDLPFSGILAVAWLYDCRPMQESDEEQACVELYERAHAWLLANVQPVPFIPCRGHQGLWNPSEEIVRRLPSVQPPV